MTDWLNVAAEGARSKGTVVRASCWRCGEKVSIRVPAVEVHQLNHERQRAERAEAAARDFAKALRFYERALAGEVAASALAAHPDFAEPRA